MKKRVCVCVFAASDLVPGPGSLTEQGRKCHEKGWIMGLCARRWHTDRLRVDVRRVSWAAAAHTPDIHYTHIALNPPSYLFFPAHSWLLSNFYPPPKSGHTDWWWPPFQLGGSRGRHAFLKREKPLSQRSASLLPATKCLPTQSPHTRISALPQHCQQMWPPFFSLPLLEEKRKNFAHLYLANWNKKK